MVNAEEIIYAMKKVMKCESGIIDDKYVNNSRKAKNMVINEIDEYINKMEYNRQENNTKWNVITHNNITSHRKILGRFIVFIKRVIRKSLKWYINPIMDQQREFNASITRTSNDMSNVLQKMLELLLIMQKNQNLCETNYNDIIDELRNNEFKLLEVEEKINRNMVPTDLNFDYFSFEQKYRGSMNDIKERQKKYLQYFIGKNKVVDIGCGRGEFVELLLENNIQTTGIDVNDNMVEFCKSKGLPVKKENLFDYLQSIEDESLDGIFAAQVIEHLTPNEMLNFIKLTYKKLKSKGVIVLETINPQNIVAVSNWFYMDISHVRPVHPLTIQFIMESIGFEQNQLIYSTPNPQNALPRLNIHGIEEKDLNYYHQSIDALNHLLYGPQDYAIVSIKK